MSNIIADILSNRILVCGVLGWAVAQILKTLIYAMLNNEFRLERMFGDGGMPSAHSATVSSMATAAAIVYGFGSFEFAISAMLAIIVMHDAMGVRMETGKQGLTFCGQKDLWKHLRKMTKCMNSGRQA